jgi:hypothetical protein
MGGGASSMAGEIVGFVRSFSMRPGVLRVSGGYRASGLNAGLCLLACSSPSNIRWIPSPISLPAA